MSGKELKQAFHKLIDEVDDEQLLADVYSILNQHKTQTVDIIDELTEEQLKELDASLLDAKEGRVISNQEAQAIIKSWFTK